MGDGTGVCGEDICNDKLFLEEVLSSYNLLDYILSCVSRDKKFTITFEPKQNKLNLIRKCRFIKRKVNLINKKNISKKTI